MLTWNTDVFINVIRRNGKRNNFLSNSETFGSSISLPFKIILSITHTFSDVVNVWGLMFLISIELKSMDLGSSAEKFLL